MAEGDRRSSQKGLTSRYLSSVRVSVALATYQGERFLPEQLDSIALQTRPPDEMMVRDDGSSDKTLDLVESFAADVPFPVTVETSEERAGSTKNFERIFSMCSGDVIVPCDQDDVWLPSKLERLESAFATSGASLVFSDAYLIDEYGRRRRKSIWQMIGFTKPEKERFAADALPMLICRSTVSGCTMAVSTDCLPLVLPFPPDPDSNGLRLPHDRWASLVVAALGKLHLVDEPLIEYRLHDDQQIGASYVGARNLVPLPLIRWRLAALSREDVVMRMDAALNHLRMVEERVRAQLEEPHRSEALNRLAFCEGHVAFRRSLDDSRLRRVRPVAREVRSGRYRRCSLGLPSVVADLTRR